MDGGIDDDAERGDEVVAVEVETGKSNIAENLAKLENAHVTTAIAVPANSHAGKKLHEPQQDRPRVEVRKVSDLAPTPLAAFFSLPGPEKLLLLEVSEHEAPLPAPATPSSDPTDILGGGQNCAG